MVKKKSEIDFKPGTKILGKYEILQLLGKGWEGKVYLVKELGTGIERAAKFFYSTRDKRGSSSKFYAKKLHKLRTCGIVIQYYGYEVLYVDGKQVVMLVSEFIEGELLSEFVARQPGKRMNPFAALHLLHALCEGIECIHAMKEYHGDLHTDNIIVLRSGLKFELKLIDLYQWGTPTAEHVRDDVVNLINIFYEVLGGKKHYAKLPPEIKDICCGLKKSLMFQKFKTAGQLKAYIESLEWS
jgi:tRNA A-37 threonylcarbamoyl transferase component Bud32